MVATDLRVVCERGRHRLCSDGFAYYDIPVGASRLRSFVGYFKDDNEAVRKWRELFFGKGVR